MKKINEVNPKIFYLELRKNGQIIFEKVKGTVMVFISQMKLGILKEL
jgi:hypothetical protein